MSEKIVDLWGEEQEMPTVRRRKNGMYVYVGKTAYLQDSLFAPEDRQIPFPDKPLKTTPESVEDAQVGLFAPVPVPKAALPELFTPTE